MLSSFLAWADFVFSLGWLIFIWISDDAYHTLSNLSCLCEKNTSNIFVVWLKILDDETLVYPITKINIIEDLNFVA